MKKKSWTEKAWIILSAFVAISMIAWTVAPFLRQ